MVNGKKSQPKQPRRQQPKRAQPKPGKSHNRGNGKTRVPTQDAFDASYSIGGTRYGYNSDHGLYAKTENAFRVHPRYRKLLTEQRSRDGTPNADFVHEFDEVIATVNGSTTFSVMSFPINPGQEGSFPVTAAVASLYERYQWDSCEFYFSPSREFFNTSGRVAFAADLEGVHEVIPANLNDMLNNSIHQDCKTIDDCSIELAGVMRHVESWFVRSGLGYPPNKDVTLTDSGRLYFASFGCNSTDPIGYLRVRGCVRFMDLLKEPEGVPRAIEHNFVYNDLTTLTTNVWEELAIGSTMYGSNGWVKGSGNVLVVPRNGWYRIDIASQVVYSAAVGSQFGLRLLLDGIPNAYVFENSESSADSHETMTAWWFTPLNKGQIITVELRAVFASGTATSAANSTKILLQACS